MSSSDSSKAEKSAEWSWHCSGNGHCGSGKWSGMNIFAMVLGFIFFWPVGLVILFWILSGRHVRDLPAAVKRQWKRAFGGADSGAPDTGNVVFNAYQQTQYDRISEIKKEIRDRARRFGEFRADKRRRADEEEFSQFMASNPPRES
ncbi:MAG: DUF2852 domain-containing protein [Thiolinea sp.]